MPPHRFTGSSCLSFPSDRNDTHIYTVPGVSMGTLLLLIRPHSLQGEVLVGGTSSGKGVTCLKVCGVSPTLFLGILEGLPSCLSPRNSGSVFTAHL